MRLLLVLTIVLGSTFVETIYAEVWIPEDEFIGFFDSEGAFTVDLTFFCLAEGMDDPAKFEHVAGGVTFGEFGCPQSTDDIKFPSKRGHHSNAVGNDKDD